MMNVAIVNDWPAETARQAFLRCCGSRSWADAMLARRPFDVDWSPFSIADEIWSGLDRSDWLEAFAAHPRIGDVDSLRTKFAATAELCSTEQGGVADADESVLHALADGNRQYEARFGYIFIVCATGKSAVEMLSLLQSRIKNDPETELRIAAAEQAKITRLRLENL